MDFIFLVFPHNYYLSRILEKVALEGRIFEKTRPRDFSEKEHEAS